MMIKVKRAGILAGLDTLHGPTISIAGLWNSHIRPFREAETRKSKRGGSWCQVLP
eukprot:CAMPEP_0174339522 /NCGR_PEP_ID=MMETSP0810-20121108/23965_1 /TAXON_ID=73025 ORGANISM="Eutreptiella gymnastica-like, Strain CCMP1594" /NCGR_SAMPLE_ID=MMETSP0810 /ASSEMBLY_ACC=CAM_ASM_000659 /LENGTH=54 /DNA_ID=CAMNT_0015460181 /DNA_START=188 /DNA_END=349 /DNA_ORIENTATION=+